MYEYIYAKILSILILRALQVSHPDSCAHILVPHLCSVCVCVCVYCDTPTPTYTPTRVKTPIFPSVKNMPPRQACAFIDYLNPHILVRFPNAKRPNCTCMSAYAHHVASVSQ